MKNNNISKHGVSRSIVLVVGLMVASTVMAQDWVPSRFGADDRIGAANYLNSDLVLQAAELIAGTGAKVEVITRDRGISSEVMSMSLTPAMRVLQWWRWGVLARRTEWLPAVR